MSLLSSLASKAVEAVLDEDKHSEWIGGGFDKALAEARGLLDSDDVDPAIKSTGERALNKLEEHRGALVEFGVHGLRSTLIYLASGRYTEAARHAALVTLREKASWDQVSETILATAEEGNEKKRQIEATQAEILAMLKDIGSSLAKAALPLILSVV